MISMLAAVLVLAALVFGFAWLMLRAERLLGADELHNAKATVTLINSINNLLPQTQCGQCGFPGCRPYAEAISRGENINRCPPGGAHTIKRIAALLDLPVVPLDTSHGWHLPKRIASIREHECIGCTKCIQACPVDAIVGAPKRMHTVIVADCTGCDLCVDPCPVDCIDMLPLPIMSAHASVTVVVQK
ncbi:MAG: electron transport complex subunit RsxB [Pseudohongiella sp.]|nr:electron transport complex subunit RsxB [Pseudohongiella sp.]